MKIFLISLSLVVALLILSFIFLFPGSYFETYLKTQRDSKKNQESNKVLTQEEINPKPKVKEETPFLRYVLQEAEVSYTAKKTFLGRSTEDVVGKAVKLEGESIYDTLGKNIRGKVILDTNKLVSNSTARDIVVRELLGNFIIFDFDFEFDKDNLKNNSTEKYASKAKGTLTINNKEVPVEFDLENSLVDNFIETQGTANINLNDFNIKPPSVINTFSVGDDVQITFNIKTEDKGEKTGKIIIDN